MNLWAFRLLTLGFCSPSPLPPLNVADIDEEQKDISEINKGLHLKEGDIMVPRERSSILGNGYLWEIPVPYVLSADLSVKYKGIILRAFERFRLKSCIDFKPRTTETSYISVVTFQGCSSYIGRETPKSQNLSIGDDCGTIAKVEHQFLHALGFYHEHTRYDRDDYVTIQHQNIEAGDESKFDKVSQNLSSVQGTPYDYMSLMHYGKDSYSNGNKSTIITKLPEFQDMIGQKLDMSEYDAIELNRLYKCNMPTTFLQSCSFDDESLCQMSFCSTTERGWQRVSSVRAVNVTDHTYLHKKTNGSSFFMHFSVEGKNEGDSARLETKAMTPTRDCKVQCLQFYYYHSGNENDKLNIWIREHQNEADSRGRFRLMDSITGPADNYWRLHHVPLNADKTFRLLFEARKGAGNSSGGFSLDDINISQTECPQIWQIRNFRELKNNTASPLYYSSEGYRYQVFMRNYETYFSLYVRLVSGVDDNLLQWPCPWRLVTFQVLDQNPHMQRRMSYERSITTDPAKFTGKRFFWDNPRHNGTQIKIGNDTVFITGGYGYKYFMYKNELSKREFINGEEIIFLFSMQDTSGLLQNNSVSCPNVSVKRINAICNESASSGLTRSFLILLVGLWLLLLN